MNMPSHRDEPEYTSQEWQAQERALRAERLGLSMPDDDSLDHSYRLVARALRQDPVDPLPADFAERVARRAGRAGLVAPGKLERRATVLLLLILAGTGLGYALGTVGAWWPAMVAAFPTHVVTSPWLSCLVACAGLTALLGRLPAFDRRTHH